VPLPADVRAGIHEGGAVIVLAVGAPDAGWRAAIADPGARVVAAHGYREAMDALSAHDVAAAVLELPAGPMSDASAATALIERLGAQRVPVLILAADVAAARSMVQPPEPAMAEILATPVDPEALRARLAALVETARMRRVASAHDEIARVKHTSERLIAVLGHDLRSPLNAISLAAETLLLARPDDETAALIAERLRSAARRMSRTVDQVVDFAALYSGSGPIDPRDADLSQLCRTAAAEFEELRQRRFTCDVNGDGKGRWDPHRIVQLFSHLIGYAVQHGKEGGSIAVRIDGLHADQVVVELEHDGTVPEPVREHLFAPFSAVSETKGGARLGLYIVAQIAQAHGGSVAADGHGNRTILRVRLPRAAAARSSSQ
jgi:two-component system, sensor histidine kinase and response regulator